VPDKAKSPFKAPERNGNGKKPWDSAINAKTRHPKQLFFKPIPTKNGKVDRRKPRRKKTRGKKGDLGRRPKKGSQKAQPAGGFQVEDDCSRPRNLMRQDAPQKRTQYLLKKKGGGALLPPPKKPPPMTCPAQKKAKE